MKFSAQYVVPIVILVVVVIISLCESCAYFKPYDSEGYDNISVPLGNSDASYKTQDKMVTDSPTQTMNSALDETDDEVSYNQVTPMNEVSYNEVTPMNEVLYNDVTPMNEVSYNDVTPMNGRNYTSVPGSGSYDTISQAASAPVIRATFAGRESFATLNDISADYGSNDRALDIYSQAKGNSTCEPGPYSNSGGYLCLNEMQQAQLNTRGGNQTNR